jgi:hypothetical protein
MYTVNVPVLKFDQQAAYKYHKKEDKVLSTTCTHNFHKMCTWGVHNFISLAVISYLYTVRLRSVRTGTCTVYVAY